MKKRLLAGLLCICLVAGLTACGNGKKWLFSLDGEKIYDKELMIYGLMFAEDYNITKDEQFDELYEDGMTYADYYKEQLEEEILSTVLFYKEAKAEKFELSKAEKKEVKEYSEKFVETYGKEWLKEQKISESDVEKIYEMKMLGTAYVESTSEENEDEKQKAERYIKVYQVTFLTVELDEEGMMKTDENGEVEKLSSDEIAEKKMKAEEFAEKVQSGEAIETLVKDYDKTVTGMEKYLKYGDLSEEYKKEVDSLSEGDAGEVISSEYGYVVFKLLDKDAEEHAAVISDYENKTSASEKEAELFEELFNMYLRDDANYKNSEKWEQVEISSFIR